MPLAAQKQAAGHRHVCQREDERSQYGEEHRQRHGAEHLALYAYERHQRDVDYHYYNLAEGRALSYPRCREAHLLVHLRACQCHLLVAYVCHDGFHDDDRRVHYHAEVYGPETHQVAVDAERLHHAEGEEHAERYDAGHDKSGAVVAKEEHEDEDHDEAALNEVARYGALHAVHELGAVDEWFYDDALGQRTLYLCDALLDVAAHLLEVLALEHDGDACHHFALAVSRDGAEACGVAYVYVRHIQDSHHCRADGAYGDVAQVVDAACHAYAAYEVLLVGLLYVAAASVGVVLLQSVEDLADGDAVGVEALRIYSHLILLHVAAPTADLRHAGRAGQLLAHYPVLYGAQVGEGVFLFVALLGPYGIVVYLAQTGGYRSHLGVGALGKVLGSPLEHLVHLRACPVDVGIVVEDKRYHGQSAARYAAALLKARYVGKCHLNGRGDVLLHLLRPESRSLGDYLYLVVGDVGCGVEGQVYQ